MGSRLDICCPLWNVGSPRLLGVHLKRHITATEPGSSIGCASN